MPVFLNWTNQTVSQFIADSPASISKLFIRIYHVESSIPPPISLLRDELNWIRLVNSIWNVKLQVSVRDFLLHSCHIEVDESSDVIVYDQSSVSTSSVAVDSFLHVLLQKLVHVFRRVFLLSGNSHYSLRSHVSFISESFKRKYSSLRAMMGCWESTYYLLSLCSVEWRSSEWLSTGRLLNDWGFFGTHYRWFLGISSVLSWSMRGQIAPPLPEFDVPFAALLAHRQRRTHQDFTFPLPRIAARCTQQATLVGTSFEMKQSTVVNYYCLFVCVFFCFFFIGVGSPHLLWSQREHQLSQTGFYPGQSFLPVARQRQLRREIAALLRQGCSIHRWVGPEINYNSIDSLLSLNRWM